VSEQIAIRAEQGSYEPGDDVRGAVEVAEATHCKKLTLALEYRDWTSDYHSIDRTVALDAPLHEGDLESGASFKFSVALPPDALSNQSDGEGSTSWGLHARVVRTGSDLHAWLAIDVPARAR
jgi:hypothetical protein